MIQIKSWNTGNLIFEADVLNIKLCVELAVKKGISLNYANLNYANLNGAELNDAKMKNAELNYAELNDAQLNNAQLNNAQLIRIDGLKFPILITKTNVFVGCRSFTIQEFKKIKFSDFDDHKSFFKQYNIVLNMIKSLENYWEVSDE